MAVALAILAIGVLIIVHEAGHYFVAKWCKMRVDRFSLGFGPAILKWRHKETDFTLGPIPFGGFVQIDGMVLTDEVDPDDKYAYPNRPTWQRFLTILAGPAMNYALAVVLAVGLYASVGVPTGTAWFSVNKAYDFDAVGKLMAGDRILSVNGEKVFAALDGEGQKGLASIVDEHGGKPMNLIVLRAGKEVAVSITPEASHSFRLWRKPRYRMGIEISLDEERSGVPFYTSLYEGVMYPVRQTKMIVTGLYLMIRGEVDGKLTGPVGITGAVKDRIELGWLKTFEFLMMLNVYLGLFNLLPLPALDGGRLAFLTYELATRKRANPKVEAAVHMVGIMAILLLLVVVSYREILELFS